MKKKAYIESPPPLKGEAMSLSERGQGRVKTALFIALGFSLLFMSACKTKEMPGRVRAPRHCNTCTKWSYVPQDIIELELLNNDEG